MPTARKRRTPAPMLPLPTLEPQQSTTIDPGEPETGFELTEPVTILPPLPTRKEIRVLAEGMGREEARHLVNMYYDLQKYRIGCSNQVQALEKNDDPHEALAWMLVAVLHLEEDIKSLMAAFTKHQPMAMWAQSIVGIGPVLAAGLVAHLDIEDAPTVGHWWRFCGLDPTMVWEKGQKRPFSASAKLLTWKIGQSFVLSKGSPRSYYGPLFDNRRAYEQKRNDSGGNAEAAKRRLTTQKIQDATLRACLESGKLPDAALHERAKRWTVKLFLAHYHGEAYRQHYGVEPPLPYPLVYLGHAHVIPPPKP